jgi:anti-sigma B factor antagonist
MKVAENGIKIESKFVDETGEILLVTLEGYLDQSNCGVLEKIINDIFESECYRIIFNMENVTYISSAGWGVFVGEIARFRVKGGDFKLFGMTPEIYQIYSMLEFYHIFEDYGTLEEVLASFGVDENVVEKKKEAPTGKREETPKIPKKLKIATDSDIFKDNNGKDNSGFVVETERAKKDKDAVAVATTEEQIRKKSSRKSKKAAEKLEIQSNPVQGRNSGVFILPKKVIPLKDLSLQEKIKKICGEYPLFGLFRIKKMLSHEEFGNVKISVFKLYKILKELNLDTKAKRYRYYRSV